MPGLPELLERPMMKEVAAMYGKIICTWQVSGNLWPPVASSSLRSDALHSVELCLSTLCLRLPCRATATLCPSVLLC
jgi:hypothetical protein